jgi:hypothetical protein
VLEDECNAVGLGPTLGIMTKFVGNYFISDGPLLPAGKRLDVNKDPLPPTVGCDEPEALIVSPFGYFSLIAHGD